MALGSKGMATATGRREQEGRSGSRGFIDPIPHSSYEGCSIQYIFYEDLFAGFRDSEGVARSFAQFLRDILTESFSGAKISVDWRRRVEPGEDSEILVQHENASSPAAVLRDVVSKVIYLADKTLYEGRYLFGLH